MSMVEVCRGAHQERFGPGAHSGSNGSVYVYVRSYFAWSLQQKIVASDGAKDDHFGVSVALLGDTLVVGANQDDDNGAQSGSVYIFVRSGTTWTQQQKIIANDGAMSDYFGSSVALTGNTLVVGAHRDDDKGIYSGSVYVYSSSLNSAAALFSLNLFLMENYRTTIILANRSTTLVIYSQ